MKCKKCGASLSLNIPTCPSCGAFLTEDQIKNFVELKKEQSKDLRPKLISERYGIKPIKYESQEKKESNKGPILMISGLALLIILLVIILIFL